MDALFVDCHSHVCPSGDDGAPSVAMGLVLCREAAERGTRVLFATPHIWPDLPLSASREAALRTAFAELREQAPLELRLGFELTPDAELLNEDLRRYELEGTGHVLVEVPFVESADLLFAVAEHAERCGLTPLIAHPERATCVLRHPELVDELAGRWPLQVNGSSLYGRDGPAIQELGWSIVERGLASIVGSDGHRPTRPATLDVAWGLVVDRFGEEVARPLFDGSVLGLTARRPTPSPAGSPGA